MRVVLYTVKDKDRRLEKPQIVGVCHTFTDDPVHITKIEVGKRYFKDDPCKPCGALIADQRNPGKRCI